MRISSFPLVALALLVLGAPAAAQQTCPCPEEPPIPEWTGSIGAGLAITQGNTDTTNVNLSFGLSSNPKKTWVFKTDGLYLRGTKEGDLTVDRTTLAVREEYNYTDRTYFYGEFAYLRDSFKEIDYLLAPTVGVGHKIIDTDTTKLSVDGGIGGVWEKNPGRDVRVAGALTANERFARKLSTNASLTQSVSALWKMNDFSDGLYTFTVGVVADLTSRSQIKFELVDTFKNEPPDEMTQKNDIALVTAVVFKF